MKKPGFLFEISWEVANLVGSLHNILASKVRAMQARYGSRYVTIGPDIPRVVEAKPVFREDLWLPELLDTAADLDVSVRMGRWLVPGEPRCLLINYGELHRKKDEILASYWEAYKLDSLFGGWDYVDPVLFSHGAGRIIEHYFMNFLLPERETVVAQAHEWTAAGALLHLKSRVPEIGTVYTAHGTAIGRAMSSQSDDASSSLRLAEADPAALARELWVVAKHSMERVAAHNVDVFTTVSDVVAEETQHLLGREPDLMLPNALSDTFPDAETTPERARERLFELAELTSGDSYDRSSTLLMIAAGRYEYVNKGINLLLDAIAAARAELPEGRRIVLFAIFPTGHAGPTRELLNAARSGNRGTSKPYLATHDLRDDQSDSIHANVQRVGIDNAAGSNVHVVHIPIYLDGNDLLIPETFQELLPGADLAAYPAQYEPWGYAALESTANGVPTLTTDLSGFGRWVAPRGDWHRTGVCVLPRRGRPYDEVVEELRARLVEFATASDAFRSELSAAAKELASHARWSDFAAGYFRAHELAGEKAAARQREMTSTRFVQIAQRRVVTSTAKGSVTAHMQHFTVRNDVPEQLFKLQELTENVWWQWQPAASKLFQTLDRRLWEECRYNPTVFMEQVSPERLKAVSESADYMAQVDRLYEQYRAETQTYDEPDIAYFCMEYGLAGYLKLYSGGLGVLAGDHLKTASDLQLKLCAVGMAYREGYFRQLISRDGHQEALADETDFRSPPFRPVLNSDGGRLTVSVHFPGGPVYVRALELRVGRVQLYLLDTNFEANRQGDRNISDRLYGGDLRDRLRQELVLGIGGFQLLQALGKRPRVYHMNEGHSAFLIFARIGQLMRDHDLKYNEAMEYVRHTTVFTTHTPVAAGHDHFPEDLIRPYLAPFESVIHKDWAYMMQLGQNPDDTKPEFGTTNLALHGSLRINGVSRKHGEVTRRMFRNMYPGMHLEEIPITSITNGVHVPSWVAPRWQRIFNETIGVDWRQHQSDEERWAEMRSVDPDVAWTTHRQLRARLVLWLKQRFKDTWRRRREPATRLGRALEVLDEDALLIGFARRFAPYKRADLIFRDIDRLANILNRDRGGLLLIAGKAHPADGGGQDLIRRIIEMSNRPELADRVLFVEDYDIDIARKLVSGCDVWLNTPRRPMEASGTSGMKAAMNGVLNLSIGDGWWLEGHNGDNGWMIGDADTAGEEQHDDYDVAMLYDLLETEVLPTYFRRDAAGVPQLWVEMMLNSIASIVPKFSFQRMLEEYDRRFYRPALENSADLASDDFARLCELNALKKQIIDRWPGIRFADVAIRGLDDEQVRIGDPIEVELQLEHPDIAARSLDVHAVVARGVMGGELEHFESYPMTPDTTDGETKSHWKTRFTVSETGPHALGVRVMPRRFHADHELEPQLNLIRWL